jgi:hypothetical protein
LAKIHAENFAEWSSLPEQIRREFVQVKKQEVLCGFSAFPFGLLEPWHRKHYRMDYELIRACAHALGNDITFEKVGSFPTATAAGALDFDYHVKRRPNSKHFGEPFTQLDKEKVAQNLEKLEFVQGPVKIGNVAIKFFVEGIPVDLVLVPNKPRVEEFPRLRGGNDSHENFERIKDFLEKTPAARYAIMGVKLCLGNERPKGILLEAIAWRFSKIFRILFYPLTKLTGNPEPGSMEMQHMLQEGYIFFAYLMIALQNWEASPFGSDLKKDLDSLPGKKREEFIQSLDYVRKVGKLDCMHTFLYVYIFSVAQNSWITNHELRRGNDFNVYLKRRLREFFPSRQ